jgi:hypothetical protein
MALVINDRVKETTTTTGTGAVSLGGAVTGFETFAAGIGNSNTVYYCIAHQDQAEFEVGLGTLDGDSSDLTRTTVISSSNSDSAVDFSAGTKDVFCTIPASKLIFEDSNNDVTVGRNLTVTGDLTITGDDITMNTNTSGAALIGDGSNFNPVVISGDLSIATNGAASLAAAQTNITSILATDLKIGEDNETKIDFETADEIHFYAANAEQVFVSDGVFGPQTDSDVDLGTNSVRFKDAYVDSVTVTGDVSVGDDLTVLGGVIEFKSNSGSPASLKMYCESSNAHFQTLQPQPHSASASNTLRLPNSGSSDTQDLVAVDITQTLTNKRLTSPKLNEDVAITATATEVNILDGVTSTTAELNILDGVTATATELNIMDGDTSASSTTLVDADRVVTNDAGTMKQVALSDIKTYLSSAGFSTEDPTALAIALG